MVKIFIVDDNAMIRAQLRIVLEKPGEWAVVGEAENGRKAVEAVPKGAPDVTVMDFLMPEPSPAERRYRTAIGAHPPWPVRRVRSAR